MIYNVVAGIVVYKPKIELLKKNIEKLYSQVDKIIVYINSASIQEIEELRNDFGNKLQIIDRNQNVGIPIALNEMMDFSIKEGAKWFLTMDQDSICPTNLIEEYSKHFNDTKIAIITPKIVDLRRVSFIKDNAMNDVYVKHCITSASCVNLKIWEKLGKFDELLFIDLVDNDFCKRVILNDYKILKINSITMIQEFGDVWQRSKPFIKTMEFFAKIIPIRKVKIFLAKLCHKQNVNPLRVYYTNRNVIYLNKKYKQYGGIGYVSYVCKTYLGFNIVYNLSAIVRGKSKRKIIQSIKNGKKEGKILASNTEFYRVLENEIS